MSSRRLFFSHAFEDKPTVEMVAALVQQHRPDVHIWIDKYEIVAGADLLEAIGEGMDRADHFFVFVSPVSVTKPWVRAELHDALTQEITGRRPGFVVPVLIGQPTEFPAFLRSRKYIDVSGLPEVWLREFDGVMEGAFSDRPEMRPNVTIAVNRGPGPAGAVSGDGSKTVTVSWTAHFFADKINYAVRTRRPVVDMRVYRRPNVFVLQMVESVFGEDGAGYRVGNPPLAAGTSMFMELDFDSPATEADVVDVGFWDAPSIFE